MKGVGGQLVKGVRGLAAGGLQGATQSQFQLHAEQPAARLRVGLAMHPMLRAWTTTRPYERLRQPALSRRYAGPLEPQAWGAAAARAHPQ
jgi:hypothetical protein